MGDKYDLITLINRLPHIAAHLRWNGEYRYADAIEAASGKLEEYLQKIREEKEDDPNSER